MIELVYKLLTEADARAAEAPGVILTALDGADGFVHLSTLEQAGETARLHFSNKGSVELLEFAAATLGDLRWEPSRNGALFPHLYGPLRLAGATRRWTLEVSPDGAPVLPPDLLP